MLKYFDAFLIASVVTFIVTPIAQKLSYVLNIVDKPNFRKVHGETPQTWATHE